MTSSGPTIPAGEYAERRVKVLEALGGAAAVVFAGSRTASSLPTGTRPNSGIFWYLTGIESEADAAILFDPSHEDPERRICLFLRPRDPETERWDGTRPALDSTYRKQTGFSDIARTSALPSRLTKAARRTQRLACLHPFASYDSDLSPDLALFKRVCERVPTAAIEDRTQLLTNMRSVKSEAELALIERAVAVTAAGFETAFAELRPGIEEGHLANTMTTLFRAEAGEPAFDPIVASGPNGTILHYSDNSRLIQDGDLVVIDYAASVGGYASDVTRTLPASGSFSTKQRPLYELVLQANMAAIEAARPGSTFTEVDKAARGVMTEAGYQDSFVHSVGHHLGLEVHDPAPDGPLTPGMIITVEPGIYLSDDGIGIRIEDDILVTESDARVLTEAIPKTVAAVEAAFQQRSSDA